MTEKIIVPPVIGHPKDKPPFPDDIMAIKQIRPGFQTHADFEWNELDRLLGEANELQESDRAMLADVLHRIIAWAVGSPKDKIRLDLIGRRVAALAWVISPNFFDGASVAELAKKAGLKTRQRLSVETASASREFGLKNHAQSHGWNFINGPKK